MEPLKPVAASDKHLNSYGALPLQDAGGFGRLLSGAAMGSSIGAPRRAYDMANTLLDSLGGSSEESMGQQPLPAAPERVECVGCERDATRAASCGERPRGGGRQMNETCEHPPEKDNKYKNSR